MKKFSPIPVALRWFLLAMILANIAGEMYYSLMPIYLRELGATIRQIGLLFSLASIVMLVLLLVGLGVVWFKFKRAASPVQSPEAGLE